MCLSKIKLTNKHYRQTLTIHRFQIREYPELQVESKYIFSAARWMPTRTTGVVQSGNPMAEEKCSILFYEKSKVLKLLLFVKYLKT